MDRRNRLFLLLILALCLLPACTSPTVTYFPVRHEPGISLALLNSGKLILDDGLLRLKEIGVDRSYFLIWPTGYSYRTSGGRVEVLNSNGKVIAKIGQYKQIGGGPAASPIKTYTGEDPPVPVPGPVWVVAEGSVKNLYLWDYGAGPYIIALIVLLLIIVTLIVWFIMRRRTTR